VILTSTVGTTNHLRYRLTGFVQEVQAGVVPHQAAQNAKLGDVFISALRMVERGEDATRVLNHAADYYEAIALRWWQAVSVVTGPLVTLLIAGVVGFVALAMFLPLVTLINTVADTVG
jgi:type II secretory pathway component PulF